MWHSQKKGERGRRGKMDGGVLGEGIRLAHALLHLLVYIGSSDLMS